MKASILINNYNYEKYLEKAIESALNQTYKNIEVIVYDDGSKDNSVNIIKGYSEKIIPIINENYGKGHCWNQINAINEAFKKSTGDIIFLMDSDDFFLPSKVERVIEVFKQNEKAVLVQHKFALVEENNEILKSEKRPFFSGINILEGIYYTSRLDFFFTQTSGLCFRRSFLKNVLPLKEDDLSLICVDIRLSRYAAFMGDIVSLQEKLTYYRIHTSNHSSALKRKQYFFDYNIQHLEFFNRLAKHYGHLKFENKNNIISYFKVLLLLLKSNMKFGQKINFLKSWYKSYINK
jgi:glycosyltransferase involved in cell wall biosynthesis